MRRWKVTIHGDGGISTSVMTSRELREIPAWFQDGTVTRVTIEETLSVEDRIARPFGEQLTLRNMAQKP